MKTRFLIFACVLLAFVGCASGLYRSERHPAEATPVSSAPNPAENAQGVVFCNANTAPYSGLDLLLNVERRGQEYFGQVIRLVLGLHSELNSSSVVFEEKVTQTNGAQTTYEGKFFKLSFDSTRLMNFDSANFSPQDGGRLADYEINGSSTSDLSQYLIKRPDRFKELICRTGSYKDRIAMKNLFSFFDSWANDTF